MRGTVERAEAHPQDDVSEAWGRILVLDDEDGIRETTACMLEAMGFEVTTARSGLEAVSCFKSAHDQGRRYRLVLADLTALSGMDGLEAVAAMRQIAPGFVAVASSGYTEAPAMARPSAHGFQGSLVKPYGYDELARAVLGSLRKGGVS